MIIQFDRPCNPDDFGLMSNLELAMDLIQKMPQDTQLEDIAGEIQLLAGIKVAREQARKSDGMRAENARKLVASWASR